MNTHAFDGTPGRLCRCGLTAAAPAHTTLPDADIVGQLREVQAENHRLRMKLATIESLAHDLRAGHVSAWTGGVDILEVIGVLP